jgi:glyoxylase-like metal-dependent hydrolase (beta-lactamase superfamily II)
VEEAVIREPRYEPVYLFGGAAPVSGLVNRFLQAEPSPVDHVFRAGETVVIDGRELEMVDLAGHSLAQVGVRAGDVLFAADGFFGREPLEKHGVPYLVDAARWMETLRHARRDGRRVDGPRPRRAALDDPRETLAAEPGGAGSRRRLAPRPAASRPRRHRGPARRVRPGDGDAHRRSHLVRAEPRHPPRLPLLLRARRPRRVVIEEGRWIWAAA